MSFLSAVGGSDGMPGQLKILREGNFHIAYIGGNITPHPLCDYALLFGMRKNWQEDGVAFLNTQQAGSKINSLDRPCAHHRANKGRQTINHTHIHTFGQFQGCLFILGDK